MIAKYFIGHGPQKNIKILLKKVIFEKIMQRLFLIKSYNSKFISEKTKMIL